MQKWEQRFIIAEKYGKGVFGHTIPKEASWKVHYVDGESMPNWSDVTLYNYLDRCGQQGWEVTAMTTHVTIRTGSLPIDHLYITMKKMVDENVQNNC